MRILAIETSCDDTAVALLEATPTEEGTSFRVLGNSAFSQVALHQEYGGVFPTVAKREHARNLVPMLVAALTQGEMLESDTSTLPDLGDIFAREPELESAFNAFITTTKKPAIDAIAVTHGPGLAPALWVGVNFANALARVWNIPIVPINHMEGHMLAGLIDAKDKHEMRLATPTLPLLGLLISGGHTELVLMKEWLSYELIGKTRDDAVGEAFDKVARMLGLPYPGGPEISKLADAGRSNGGENPFTLPRPMITEDSCNFSWSGLKTSVLYLLKKQPHLSEEEREKLAEEFEDAVVEVLWKKTARAITQTDARMLALGGGVSANRQIRKVFTEKMAEEFPERLLSIPPAYLTTDNAVMIAIAGYYRMARGEVATTTTANANLVLAKA